eukprot:CAMPEP_0195281470 /NCGR_PEP_ID=MMETSP0707-20130614/760_1 /TAXON_ID=33640 /ORGANISM="Asterionellopsis glacialis, Strain CCMP134" /LENGTH=468 /DNA_ID=CAMNT_0040340353 /DNA_START=59 /DNA_END=1465 /DNA_ORIENTATION=-
MDAAPGTSGSSTSGSASGVGVGGTAVAPSDFKGGMFGSAGAGGGASELLGGTFTTGMTNGGYVSVAGGGDAASDSVGGNAFDLSEFPSLAGGSSAAGGGGANNNGGASNQLSSALRQQQLLAQRQMQMQSSSTAMKPTSSSSSYGNNNGSSGGGSGGAADGGWPALPGAAANGSSGGGSAGSGGSGSSSGANSPFLMRNSGTDDKGGVLSRTGSNVNSGGTFPEIGSTGSDVGGINHLDGSALLGGGAISILQQQQQQQQQQNPQQQPRSTSTGGGSGGTTAGTSSSSSSNTPAPAAPGSALRGDYGLLGLLQLIRMPDCDRKALALGTELSLFAPWSDKNGGSKEPNYQLPMCYYMQPPALKTGHLTKFQPETLFYIFYGLPKDILQAYSAEELYKREWRYHTDLELWFKEVGPADGVPQAPPSQNGQPQYMYFDINSWERRLCNQNKNVTSGFLPEEDVRVKFPSS